MCRFVSFFVGGWCVTGVFVRASGRVLAQNLLDMLAVALRENELAAKADERRRKRELQEKKRSVSAGAFVCLVRLRC